MAATFERIDFSSAKNLNDVIALIRIGRVPNQEKIIRLLQQFDHQTYDRNITLLKMIGFTTNDELRIFKYRGGRFRFDNRANTLNTKEYKVGDIYLVLDSSLLKNYPKPDYIIHPSGIVIPFFYDGRNFIYLPDSEYFLRGKKIFITPTIYEGIQMVTQHRVEADRLPTLIKYLDPDTNYIYVKENGIIHNINGDFLYAENLDEIAYLQAIRILDEFKQPYPKNFMLSPEGIDPGLLKFVRQPELAFMTNLIVTQDFLNGAADFYRDLGITNICTNLTLTLLVDTQNQVSDIIPPQLVGIEKPDPAQLVIRGIVACRQPVLIQPIGLLIEDDKKVQRHLIVIILDVVQGRGYLFDPSYIRGDNYFEEIYTNVIRYFKRSLRREFPTLEIRSLSDFGCPFGYALQERGDVYCRSWSLYLTSLYLLNPDRSFEEIVTTLYEIGFPGIRVIIPRFLFAIHGEDLALDLDDPTDQEIDDLNELIAKVKTPKQQEVAPKAEIPTQQEVTPEVEIPPTTLQGCRDLLTEWGWQLIPLVQGKPNYEQEPEELGVVTGQASGLVVLTISPNGLDYWKQVLGNNEIPLTFTVVSVDDEISYYFQNIGVDDIPNLAIGDDIFFHSNDDFVVAPCSERYEVVEGLVDTPLLGVIPTWLANFLRESLHDEKPDYTKLRIPELKQLLRDRNLPVTGRKDELIRRIEESDRR